MEQELLQNTVKCDLLKVV